MINLDHPGTGRPPAVPLDGRTQPNLLNAVLKEIQAIQKLDDIRSFFLPYRYDFEEVGEKVISLCHTVEALHSRLYGIAICKFRGRLSQDEIDSIKYYCKERYYDGWGEGYVHCPKGMGLNGWYIHFWQDENDPILTKEELEIAERNEDITAYPLGETLAPDAFWALIAQAKEKFGEDMRATVIWLTGELVKRGPEAALHFHDIMHAYSDLADRYGLWDAASIIKEHGCSDDGFQDFRSWLIAQGKEVYLDALKDPDSLADIDPYGDCCFEGLAYVGDSAYEHLTGRSAYDDTDQDLFEALKQELSKEIAYKGGIQYPREPRDLPAFLPKLCAKYGGPDRFCVQASTWNYDLNEIRKLLAAGKLHDLNRGSKKGKQRGDAR